MNKFLLVGLSIAVGFSGSLDGTTNSPFLVGVIVRQADHDIEFTRDGNFLAGTRLDTSELNIDDNETVFQPVLKFNFPESSITVRGSQTDLEGSAIVARQITFGNTRFSGGSSVRTKIDFDEVDMLVEKRFDEGGGFDLGWIFGLHYMDLEASITDGSKTVADDFNIPWITPGLKARQTFGKHWALEGSVQALSLEIGSHDFTQVDAELVLRLEGLMFWDFEIGYDFRQFEGESDDFEFDLSRSGPFLGFYGVF